MHWFNVFLKAARRIHRAELTGGVDQHWYRVSMCCCYPRIFPIKQLSLTSAPEEPIQITLLAAVTLNPALTPRAIFKLPVLLSSALVPTAVLSLPVVLLRSASRSMAVLSLPVVLFCIAP